MNPFDVSRCYTCNKTFSDDEMFILVIHNDSEGSMGSFVCESCLGKDSSNHPILADLEKSFYER
jgi:hypothetical protein